MKPGTIACRVMLIGGCGCFIASAVIGGLRFPGFAILVIGLVAWANGRRWRGSGNAHGTARVADLQDLQENGLLEADGGLILGRSDYTSPPSRMHALRYLFRAPISRSDVAVRLFLAAFNKRKQGRPGLIRLRHFVNLVTIAATGRGKGIGVLVPNLLSYRPSCVVTDPKSELFQLTGLIRQNCFKHRVVRLDPFGLAGPGSDALNPLDLIDPNSPQLIEQCRDLANMLVVRTRNEHEPHFNDAAELVLTAFIAFVAACETAPEHRNLQTVRDIVSSRARFAKAIEAMQKSTACGGILQRYGHLLTWFVDRELGSVLTTVQRHTIFLDSQAVSENTSRSTFDPRRLRDERMTIYLCLPHDRLETLSQLQRMWIGSILRAVASRGPDERNPVLFLLDEAGHLGHIQALEDAVTMLRGMGVRLWFFFQSVGQLSKCFGDRASIFLDNIDTQQFFGMNAIESADLISKRLGDATITTESFQQGTSYSRSTGGGGQQQSGQHSTSSTTSYSEMARRLLKPEEVIRLPEDMVIIFHRNLPPILASLVKYFEAPEFRKGGIAGSWRSGFDVFLTSLCTCWRASCSLPSRSLSMTACEFLRYRASIGTSRSSLDSLSSSTLPILSSTPWARCLRSHQSRPGSDQRRSGQFRLVSHAGIGNAGGRLVRSPNPVKGECQWKLKSRRTNPFSRPRPESSARFTGPS